MELLQISAKIVEVCLLLYVSSAVVGVTSSGYMNQGID